MARVEKMEPCTVNIVLTFQYPSTVESPSFLSQAISVGTGLRDLGRHALVLATVGPTSDLEYRLCSITRREGESEGMALFVAPSPPVSLHRHLVSETYPAASSAESRRHRACPLFGLRDFLGPDHCCTLAPLLSSSVDGASL